MTLRNGISNASRVPIHLAVRAKAVRVIVEPAVPRALSCVSYVASWRLETPVPSVLRAKYGIIDVNA